MAGYQTSYERELHRRKMNMMRMKEERKRKRRISMAAKMFLVLFSIIAFSLIVTRRYSGGEAKEAEGTAKTQGGASGLAMQEAPVPAQDTPADPGVKEDASVRIGSAGDVILHLPIIKAYGGIQADAGHDFKPALETFRSVYESVDFMTVNLESAFGGPDKPYSGFPNFNVPDEIALNLMELGVDLQLLANNHIYDCGKDGFLRTMSVLDQYGAAYTGARDSEEKPRYLIRDLNGIRIGFINYTYEMEHDGGRKSINGNIMDKSVENLLNSFELSDMDDFYSEFAQEVQKMRSEGAEFIIAYIHWGIEYELSANDQQKEIAAKLCDMGVDALIGGHPHVVQPLEVFTSSDGTHKMFCAYSLGNHFSNQRRDEISSRPNGHTEDGLFLSLTITRAGGAVSITDIEAVPTYVYKTEVPAYYVIPIFDPRTVEEQTGLNGIQAAIQTSYDRTCKILGNGVEDAKRELGIPME